MGMSSYEAEARALIKEHGTFMRRALHGDLWMIGETTVQAQTHAKPGGGSGDPRAWKNTLAEVRRALRGPSQEGKIEMSHAPSPATPSPPKSTLLADLGIHVQRTRRVIEETRAEVTIPIEAVAKTLGLVPEGAAAEFELNDANGDTVPGPVMLVVKTMAERDV
jgi:hypothetical protein